MLQIRPAQEPDTEALLQVERAAFGTEEEADLVRNLLADPTAQPLLSLLAVESDRAVGHILFTAAGMGDTQAALLAPMAVVPDAQNRGIGGKLIADGLTRLADTGVALVFVLGHPGYYPRYGFQPAGRLGFDAPYPIAERNADAWMVQALRPGIIGTVRGTVTCAKAIDRPEYWQE